MLLLLLILQFTSALGSPQQPDRQICTIPDAPPFAVYTDICVLSQAPVHENRKSSNKNSSPLEAWKPGGPCRGARADKFCVFTNLSFNHGEGVSIITTAKSISTIATRPAFSEDEDGRTEETNSGPIPPYREVEIAGKDIGLVATRPIRAGELIMARTPSFMVNEKAIQILGGKIVQELLVHAADNLPSQHKESVLKLSSHSVVSDYGEKLYKILQTNSFRTGYHDGVDPPLQIRSVRQEKLFKEWGFKCTCQRCSVDEAAIAKSDQRVNQIYAIRKELDDHSAESKGSPEKAELLISLYEQEGILGRLNEAYYRAALEYLGVGDTANATKYARLCADHGLLYVGLDRPFIQNMQDLIANPMGHPKWRFRLEVAAVEYSSALRS
ncbi:hypothetical protein M426DRAFT_66270 [Hypoxylon sp. CI-4A]|nr:hypothetical protein M426DRAFT_66270 [Hypoxylon sp. CI-4A]